MDEQRQSVADSLAYTLKELIERGVQGTILITGGDCLFSFLQAMRIEKLFPICDLIPGVALSAFHYDAMPYYLLSKSGGFGGEGMFRQILDAIGCRNACTACARK